MTNAKAEAVVDMTAVERFTIDGLLDLHAEHGDLITAVITPEQMDYVRSQFKQDVTEIRTTGRNDWHARKITLREVV